MIIVSNFRNKKARGRKFYREAEWSIFINVISLPVI